MATTANRQEFIRRTRALAADFVKASDTFNALAAELVYTHLAEDPNIGGLTPDDFIGVNADLTAGHIINFYATMQALLAPLTTEQRETIYAVKGSSNIIPPITPIM